MGTFLSCLEEVIAFLVATFVFCIRVAHKGIEFLLTFIELVFVILLFIGCVEGIKYLPQPWQARVIHFIVFSSVLIFVSLVALAIWKPDRFEHLFSKMK